MLQTWKTPLEMRNGLSCRENQMTSENEVRNERQHSSCNTVQCCQRKSSYVLEDNQLELIKNEENLPADSQLGRTRDTNLMWSLKRKLIFVRQSRSSKDGGV